MLVLARQKDQSIIIGDEVQVKVVDVRGDKVRLGISAPSTVSVHRKEIYDCIQRENRSSAEADFSKLPEPAVPRKSDDPFLLAALLEAHRSLAEGGIPIGAVLVRNNQIISRGRNCRVQNNSPLAQAELDCLTHAGRQPSFADTTLYCTSSPSPLGLCALRQLKINRVIVGDASVADAARIMRSYHIELINLRDTASMELHARFAQEHPELWKENQGE